MHAGASPSRGLAAGVAIVISLNACGAPPPDAASLLKQSSQRMLGLNGFHFQMQISGFTGPDEPVQSAQGDAHPPALHARVNLKEGSNLWRARLTGNLFDAAKPATITFDFSNHDHPVSTTPPPLG